MLPNNCIKKSVSVPLYLRKYMEKTYISHLPCEIKAKLFLLWRISQGRGESPDHLDKGRGELKSGQSLFT